MFRFRVNINGLGWLESSKYYRTAAAADKAMQAYEVMCAESGLTIKASLVRPATLAPAPIKKPV